MEEEVTLEHVLGGIAAIHDELSGIRSELKLANKWLHRLYNVDMTMLAHKEPEIFEKLDLVHNRLNMFMEEDWENRL